MSLLMTFRIAFKALARNKLRTALTMLGMIIGVAAVIAMVALGSGAQATVEAQIKSTGTNLITIMPGNFTAGRCAWRRRHEHASDGGRRGRDCANCRRSPW